MSCPVPQAKRHAHKFKQTKRRNNSHLGDVGGGNWDLEIALPQVQFAKHRAAVEMSHQIGHVGQRVFVLHRLEVKAAVIAAGPLGSVFFPHHVQRATPLAAGAANNALVEHSLKLRLGCRQPGGVQAAESGGGRLPHSGDDMLYSVRG
jgi:hypothetical protein